MEIVNKFGPELFPDFDHLSKIQFDETFEDKKTEELRKRRRLKRKQERAKAKESLPSSDSDAESLSNAPIFANSSDAESEYSVTSTSETEGEQTINSTGISSKIRDTLRERRIHDENVNDVDDD